MNVELNKMVKNILVLKASSLFLFDDQLFHIKENFSNAKITVLLNEEQGFLYENSIYVDNVILYDNKKFNIENTTEIFVDVIKNMNFELFIISYSNVYGVGLENVVQFALHLSNEQSKVITINSKNEFNYLNNDHDREICEGEIHCFSKEVAEFLKEPLDEVEQKIKQGCRYTHQLWNKVSPCEESDILKFYSESPAFIYELNAHSGTHLNYVQHIYELAGTSGKKILEHGSGVGHLALFFARRGYNVTCLDLEGRLLDFVRYKFSKRNILSEFIGISKSDFTLEDQYDTIISIHTLEHVTNPFYVLKTFYNSLSDNGRLIIWVHFRSSPLHINKKTGLTEKKYFDEMIKIGFKPYKIYGNAHFSDICDKQEGFHKHLLQVWQK